MLRTHTSPARASWALVALAIVVQLVGLQCTVGRTEVDARYGEVSPYEAVVNGDEISIFEMVESVETDLVEDEDDEASSVSTWSRLRSLMGTAKFDKVKGTTKKIDCRKPKNKKKKACRKPSKPSTSKPSTTVKRPPPPKRRPPPPRPKSPPPPPPDTAEEEVAYEAPDFTPAAPPPPVPIPYNQVNCAYRRKKILSGPRMVPNGGLRACTGLHVADAGACCETCRGTVGCNGWMYTKPLDCRTFGDPNPQNVCYMLSDTTGSYDPIMPELEYYSGTAFY